MYKEFARYVLLVAVIIGAVMCAGRYWECTASRRDLAHWGSEGSWIAAPSGRLFMRRQPRDPGNIILLDAGASATSVQMEPWADAFSAYGSPLTFDRSGLGLSYPANTANTLKQTGADTEALIAHIKDPKPIVYVGYSLSAALAVDYARDHRQRIRALILLDPSSDQLIDYPPWRTTLRAFVGKERRQEIQACFGWTRLMFLLGQLSATLDARQIIETSCHHVQTGLHEIAQLAETVSRTDFSTSMGDVPVIIVSSGPAVTELQKFTHAFHGRLTKLSSRSHLIQLPDVDHKTMIKPENAARIAKLTMAYVD